MLKFNPHYEALRGRQGGNVKRLELRSHDGLLQPSVNGLVLCHNGSAGKASLARCITKILSLAIWCPMLPPDAGNQKSHGAESWARTNSITINQHGQWDYVLSNRIQTNTLD